MTNRGNDNIRGQEPSPILIASPVWLPLETKHWRRTAYHESSAT